MNKFLVTLWALVSIYSFSQSKSEYLKNNRADLNFSTFNFPQKDFKIIGFGAYHGSAKTEKAEYALLKSLTNDAIIKYYLPETDFSIAHYFDHYLKSGDTILLKDLVTHYGMRVPQERSIETYNKWKEIRKLNQGLPKDSKLTVVGIDKMVSYKYTSKHLLEIIDFKANREKSLSKLVNMVQKDTTDYSPYYDSYSKAVLKEFVSNYESHPQKFEKHIKDKFAFSQIITNLKISFDDASIREVVIFENYKRLMDIYKFDKTPQFLRFGFFHIEKEREGNNVPFFSMLIDKKIYPRDQVISVIGYLTDSEVLWDSEYDDHGEYKSFTTEAGMGIGDYEKEYFRGIDNLKSNKVSDLTLFRLNHPNTPYNDGIPDLIEIIMIDEKANGEVVKGKSTTAFLDYGILISNSKANTPIEEMK